MNSKPVELVGSAEEESMPAYKNPDHPSNRIRPKVKCWGCGNFGCVGKHWGNWCFGCNVRRIDRISNTLASMESLESYNRRMSEAVNE
jgi:hypothetical protein